jgi:hypothetical protein
MILSFFNLRVIISEPVFILVCGEIFRANFIEVFKEGCDVWGSGHTPDGQSGTWTEQFLPVIYLSLLESIRYHSEFRLIITAI